MADKREELARFPIETHKYRGKRYLTLDSIDKILALFPDIEEAIIQARKEQMVVDWAQAGKDVEEAKKQVLTEFKKVARTEVVSGISSAVISLYDWNEAESEIAGKRIKELADTRGQEIRKQERERIIEVVFKELDYRAKADYRFATTLALMKIAIREQALKEEK